MLLVVAYLSPDIQKGIFLSRSPFQSPVMIHNSPSRIDAATHFLLKVWPCAWILICALSILAATEKVSVSADVEENAASSQIAEVCRKLQTATVRIRSGSDVSSGVIVSASGLVLTVAHGLIVFNIMQNAGISAGAHN